MLTVEEARRSILAEARPSEPRRVSLSDALGCVLAEPTIADLDLPPFDKALMDGYAVRSSDCPGEGPHILSIGEEILAGRIPTRPLAPRESAVIMTGAPLPEGADAVVMHERTRIREDGQLEFSGLVSVGLARLLKGREMTTGQVLFPPGTLLDAVKLGVLAAIGADPVLVRSRPMVSILPTGDELVTPRERPGPGQIRETNATTLAAFVRTIGGIPSVMPIAPDDDSGLRQSMIAAFAQDPDILLLCGGVSAGKKDLVPQTLASLGVEQVFHRVRLKPGKPILFGRGQDSESGRLTFVLALPGNPASVVVNFLLFVAPLMKQLQGIETSWAEPPGLPLDREFRHKGDRPTYYPAELLRDGSGLRARPMDWAGSSDLYTLARADGFLCFPAGDHDYEVDELVPFLPYPSAQDSC